MQLIDKFLDALKTGNAQKVADLFTDDGILHDSSQLRLGKPSLNLRGRMAIEISYHNRFGFNGGAFPLHSPVRKNDSMYYIFITYQPDTVACCIHLAEERDNKIARLNIYPL